MQGLPTHGHEPVMVEEVLGWLALEGRTNQDKEEGGMVMMDCTLGRGGHALRIAEIMGRMGGGMLIGLDVDPENLKYARKRFEEAFPPGEGRAESGQKGGTGGGVELRTFHANFGEAEDVLEVLDIPGVDGLLADFGTSTNQLLDQKHGLSFSTDAMLDMRLDPRISKNAADLLAEMDEERLTSVLHDYAQERFARRIARKIIQTRATEPILTTGQLARLVRSAVPGKWGQIDPATRTFQALRMAVNTELESIEDLLASVPDIMNPEGRSVFLSFHSGEDRLVKQAAKEWESAGLCEILTKKPVEPSEGETHKNPRSRSAKLRAARFIGNVDQRSR